MGKKWTRGAATLLALAASASVVGCGGAGGGGGGNTSVTIDSTKTQLYVANYNGGYGHVWLDNVIKKFEEEMKNESFEPNKTGVQVVVTNAKDEISGYTLYSTIQSLNYDMFFSGTPRLELLAGDYLVDLGEFVKEPIGFGETKSIWDKMSDYCKEQSYDYVTKPNGKIYYVPYAEAAFGISVYDVDLFEQKQYFVADGSTAENIQWTGTGTKSAGPDGVKGTYDDGCPSTEGEFYALLKRIKSRGDIPYTWAGQYPAYMNAFVFNLDANYDDGARLRAYNTLSGEMELVDGTKVTITPENGELTGNGAGTLKALQIAEAVTSKSDAYYSANAWKTTQSHIQAQNEFLTSVNGRQRIAMLLEGSWWENEAMATFDSMGQKNAAYAYKTRRLGVMPVFKTSASATKTSIVTSNMAAFINKTTTKLDLAKTFLKYCHTDASLKEFNLTTGVPTPYDYTLSDEELNTLSFYQKQLYEMMKVSTSVNKCTENRWSNYYINFSGDYPQNMTSKLDGADIHSPFKAYYQYNVTAREYFAGMQTAYNERFAEIREKLG